MERDINTQIKYYESEIRKIVFWYKGLWSINPSCMDDLLSAGREAIWRVSEKRKDKIDNMQYIRAAVKYSIFGRLRELNQKIPGQIHLIRRYEKEIPAIDTIPAYLCHDKKLENAEELAYYIKNEFSPEAAESLTKLVEKCETIFDLNLSEPPPTKLKDKTKIVIEMDLRDDDMLTYACLLIGAIEKFPRDYVVGQNKRAKKYITCLLKHLQITPEEFAQSQDKERIIKKYGLDTFIQRVYGHKIRELIEDIFPDIEPHHIMKLKNRWNGQEGLINAWNAIDWLRRKTGKTPKEMTRKDFFDYHMPGILAIWFNQSHRRAVEFRYPGTYPELSDKVKPMRNIFKIDD